MFLTLRASSSRAQLHVDLLHVLPISRSSSAWDTRFDPSVRSRTFSQSTKVSRADLSVAIHAEADQRIELARERPKSTVDRRLRIPVNAAKSTKVSTKGRTSIKARRVERSAPKVKRKQQASFGPSKDGHASRVDESALRKWGIRQVNSNSEVDKVEALPRDERNGGEGGTAEVKSEELEEALRDEDKVKEDPEKPPQGELIEEGRIAAKSVRIEEVKPLREMKIAKLAHGLNRVLFSPGVHPFRDYRTGVWNFQPDFHHIPHPDTFAFDRCPTYVSPSKDEELLQLAEKEECRFIGSTSTLTQALSQIYFAISGGKGVDLKSLSQDFNSERTDFTSGASLPACLVVGKVGNDRYYIDSDKRWDAENILSEYGVVLEKLLVTERGDFNRFLKSAPDSAVSEEERNEKEAYRYQKSGTLLMRSQLDCHDPRLPGSGVFDIKTRACLPIRHDRANYVANSVYAISKDKGYNQSFEREFYDVVRSGMLKWSMQARIGGMDGIFVAYHNTSRLFGFQYLPMADLDERLFGSSDMGGQAFQLTVSLFEVLMKACVDAFPDKDISVVLKKSGKDQDRAVVAYVSPVGSEEETAPIQTITMELKSILNGTHTKGPVNFRIDPKEKGEKNDWEIEYSMTKSAMDEPSQQLARQGLKRALKVMSAITAISVPEGLTVAEMQQREKAKGDNGKEKAESTALTSTEADSSSTAVEEIAKAAEQDSEVAPSKGSRVRWKQPDQRILELRKEAKESGAQYDRVKKGYKSGQFAWTALE